MNDHTHDYQPPTLREVLDRGEDLAQYISLASFAVDLAEIEVTAPKALRGRLRGRLADWPHICGDARPDVDNDLLHELRTHELRTQKLWAIEILDHRDLMARVVAVLPPDVIDELRRRVYEQKHEHPLEVGLPVDHDDEPTDWNCYNCGTAHDAGEDEALIIGGLDYPLFYCRSCIVMAAVALSELDTIA